MKVIDKICYQGFFIQNTKQITFVCVMLSKKKYYIIGLAINITVGVIMHFWIFLLVDLLQKA